MATKQFKDIIDDKGYSVTSKDRKIFERDLSKSLFGLDGTHWFRHGKTDVIEFILYDSNDNQLPQGDDGRLVNYIYLDSANIRNYFSISDVPDAGKLNEARKYLIDSEKLIKEAGYTNGIFKTQITLLNRRVGSEETEFDKLWIHEISPSRTEIRVLPVKMEDDMTILPDLAERYAVYTNDGDFRDDTISFVQQFIEKINIQTVLENFLKIKGIVTEGQNYVNLIKTEFKISEFDKFLNQIREKYIEAMTFYVQNRVYDINSLGYGNPLGIEPNIELSVSEIEITALEVLHTVIDFYLPKRTIIANSILSKEDQITFDPISQILKTTTVSSNYESTIPNSITAIIRGCMDPNASNYNPLAMENDGSCTYAIDPTDNVVGVDIAGCTNPKSINYNPLATTDDGSCRFFQAPTIITEPIPNKEEPFFEANYTTTKTFYVWSTTGRINYYDGGGARKWSGVEYASVTITYQTGKTLELIGDIREIPKPHLDTVLISEDVIPPIKIAVDTTITTYPTPIISSGGSRLGWNETRQWETILPYTDKILLTRLEEY
jgi:hypothetical protein